jgi:hypothetical protein
MRTKSSNLLVSANHKNKNCIKRTENMTVEDGTGFDSNS